MFIWYRNSILASLVSIVGCGMVVVGYINEEFLLLVVGIALAVAGKVISVMKD